RRLAGLLRARLHAGARFLESRQRRYPSVDAVTEFGGARRLSEVAFCLHLEPHRNAEQKSEDGFRLDLCILRWKHGREVLTECAPQHRPVLLAQGRGNLVASEDLPDHEAEV